MPSNPYYVATGAPGSHADGLSAQMRAEFRLITTGFDLQPKISTTGQYGTTFIQQGSYTFTLPSGPGTLALLSDVSSSVAAEAFRASGAETALSLAVTNETTRATAAEALLAPKLNPTFPSNVIVGNNINVTHAGVGGVTLQAGDATHTGYVGFFNAAGVRQAYIGFDYASDGHISMVAEDATTGFSVGGTLSTTGNIAGAAMRATQGAPNNADQSTNGFGFGIDGDTGIFSPLLGAPAGANGIVSVYSNSAEVARFVAGTVTMNGAVAINDFSTNNTSSLVISSTGNADGANIVLIGNGGATPRKYIRSLNGHLGIVSHDYSSEILTLDDAGNLTIPGTFRAGYIPDLATETARATAVEALLAPKLTPTLTGPVTINDPSGNDVGALIITASSDTSGVNVKLIGNGSYVPSKTIRSYNGHLGIVNDSYTSEIMTLDDAGNLVVTGAITANGGIPALTAETARAMAAEAVALGGIGRNRIINGGFGVNQRSYATGTALAAGAYAHDRWKAGSAGCTYTFTQSFPSTLITIGSGTLVQVIEGASLESGNYTLSWFGSATARVGGSGSFVSSPIVYSLVTPGTSVAVEFTNGSVGLVQFEPGTSPTVFARRSLRYEIAECQRFFQLVSGYGLITATAVGQAVCATATMAVTMRTVPTISIWVDIAAPGNVSPLTTDMATVGGFRISATSLASGGAGFNRTYACSADL